MEEQKSQNEKKDVKRIYRSQRSKVISGVCGGFSEYFEVDVAIIRILFVLLALIQGIGLLIYIVAIFIIPVNPYSAAAEGGSQSSGKGSQSLVLIIGGILILIGLYYTMDNIFYFPRHIFYSFPFRFDWDLFWPVLLILVGVLYLIHINQKGKAKKTEIKEQETVVHENGKKLLRSRTDRKISGVCGGLAAYFDIDSTIIRILWVILTLFVGAILLGIIAYIVMAIFIPDER